MRTIVRCFLTLSNEYFGFGLYSLTWLIARLKLPYVGKLLPVERKYAWLQTPWVEQGYICNFWNWLQAQIWKFGKFLACISETDVHRAKISSISNPLGKTRAHVWNFSQIPGFMSKYRNLNKKDPYLENSCPKNENKLTFDQGSKESTYATSGTFFEFQVSCPNMAILKIDLYLENWCP